MKGYKAFSDELKCRGFQYEIGETYYMDGVIKLCESGFHFCVNPRDCFLYYPEDARICEIEAGGTIIEGGNKSVCSKIKIVSEIRGAKRGRILYGNCYGYGNGYGYGNSFGYDKGINKVLNFKEV